MTQASKVIIIDDDKMSSHNWSVLLKFVGEDPVCLETKAWQKDLEGLHEESDDLIFMLSQLTSVKASKENPLELIQAIHQSFKDAPILFDINDLDLDSLPDETKHLIFQLPLEPTYESLLQVLQDARNAKGLNHAAPVSKIISESGVAMFRSLVGDSQLMQETRKLMHQVADKLVNVLVLGESGTGKEIMARNLHYHSGRGDKPFVVVNCATVSNELFGYEVGFNGAVESQPGLFEKADKGTLFLDCISDMPLETQAKVMRFLDHQGFERLGSSITLQPDVRVVAATNEDIEEKIKQGLFREDLYYRLSVVPIKVPALRDHIEDLPALVGEIISRLEHQIEVSVRFNSSALASLQQHPWPGNVRELANLVERLSIIQTNEVVGFNDLPVEYQHETLNLELEETAALEEVGSSAGLEKPGSSDFENVEKGEIDESGKQESQSFKAMSAQMLKEYLLKCEKHLIQVALSDCAGLSTFTAERLGMTEEFLEEKIQEHGL